MKIKINPSPYNDKYNYTHQVGEVIFKCGTTIEARFVDGRQNIFVLGNDCYIIEGADEDIDVLSKPLGVWGCSSDISTIWDRLSELERECDNQIKQSKETIMNLNIECTNGKISNMEVVIEKFADRIVKEAELSQAKLLLESNGYKVELPYIQPTESEICERIKFENDKVGITLDWNDGSTDKYYIYYNYSGEEYDYGSRQTCEILGVTYTTQSIAKQIVAELNEKRFVRV